MPLYEYKCDSCEYNFETVHSIKDDMLKCCPECGEYTLQTVFGTPFVLIYGEPATVEHQAARNVPRIGKQEIQERVLKNKELRRERLKNAKLPKGAKQVLLPKEDVVKPYWYPDKDKLPNQKRLEEPGYVENYIERGIK